MEKRGIWSRFKRLFVIKTKFEAYLVIYALALGATARGAAYMEEYPGWGGQLLFLATTGAVFLAGAAILDMLKAKKRLDEINDEAPPE